MSFQYLFFRRLYVFNFQLSIKSYLHIRALDYTTVVMSGKVGIPLIGLTTPAGWLWLLQLNVLSANNHSVIEVLVAFLCCYVAFWIFSVGVWVFVMGLNQISFFFSETLNGISVSHAFYFIERKNTKNKPRFSYYVDILIKSGISFWVWTLVYWLL